MAGDPVHPPMEVAGSELKELYRRPLEEFTSSRDALAARLRAGGEREAGAWVKGLRKPSQAAWLANQLAARNPADVESLLAAGARLRELQERLLGGEGDPEGLRAAAQQERSAVERLRSAAAEIAAEQKAGAAALDRVGETLQAAVGDPAVAEALRLGRLTREQRASSVALAGGAALATETGGGARSAASGGAKGAKKRRRKSERDGERAAKERAAREAERRRRKAAERALSAAERKLESERQATERAREALAGRQRRLAEAQRALTEARRELKRVR